jgi:hypothetical protein
MKRVSLLGTNALGQTVQYGHEVAQFIDADKYFSIKPPVNGVVTLVTPKGSYALKAHGKLNIFSGICNGHKVHLSLKKIVGEIRFW